jgi:hypothetical protein
MSSACPTLIEADPVLSALWRYWDGKRAAGVMPRRRDLDPLLEVPKLLPHLLLVERIDGRFRWRLAGSAVVEAYGQELSGRWASAPASPSTPVWTRSNFSPREGSHRVAEPNLWPSPRAAQKRSSRSLSLGTKSK